MAVNARERILETATQLFYRDCIHPVGIDLVIAESGVARCRCSGCPSINSAAEFRILRILCTRRRGRSSVGCVTTSRCFFGRRVGQITLRLRMLSFCGLRGDGSRGDGGKA
jgi:hypothetical protein